MTEPIDASQSLISDESSWTMEDLNRLRESGLIPAELFDPSRSSELCDYLRKNKTALHTDFNRHSKDNDRTSQPPPSGLNSALDLHLIDQMKAQSVNELGQIQKFELCDGVSLRIKTIELLDLEKETANAKTLNKEQNETLKKALERLGPDKTLNRNEIIALIEEVRKPQKVTKYRQSGHLVDQKLKYQQPENQPSLFDVLLPETIQKIEESRLEVKAEGIRLSYAENKLLHALNLLLFEKSQHTDPKSDNFYAGNIPSDPVLYGLPDGKAHAPMLKFKPAELYKAFTGNGDYSGADVRFIADTLNQLESKKVLIKYDRVKRIKEGNKTKTLTDRIEDFQSLIKIISFIPDLSDEEKSALDSGDSSVRNAKGEIIIALNPIFRDQIDTKYIEFPEDAQRRLVIAAGGHKKVTASMQRLMEYMLREISAKRYSPEINEEKFPYILGLDTYVKQKRKKLIQDRISKSIQAIINMGIILSAEKKQNSVGSMKWVFELNKDYD